jgi:hypothetical protein
MSCGLQAQETKDFQPDTHLEIQYSEKQSMSYESEGTGETKILQWLAHWHSCNGLNTRNEVLHTKAQLTDEICELPLESGEWSNLAQTTCLLKTNSKSSVDQSTNHGLAWMAALRRLRSSMMGSMRPTTGTKNVKPKAYGIDQLLNQFFTTNITNSNQKINPQLTGWPGWRR